MAQIEWRLIGALVTTVAPVFSPRMSRADESGISFWLAGLYGSLAATPGCRGNSRPDDFRRPPIRSQRRYWAARCRRRWPASTAPATFLLEHLVDVFGLGSRARQRGDANRHMVRK